MNKRRDYEELGDIELSPEDVARVELAVEQAEQDLNGARVSLRWGQAQVEIIKRAAAQAGVPYQTYIKLTAFRQAVSDLNSTRRLTRPSEGQ